MLLDRGLETIVFGEEEADEVSLRIDPPRTGVFEAEDVRDTRALGGGTKNLGNGSLTTRIRIRCGDGRGTFRQDFPGFHAAHLPSRVHRVGCPS